MGRALLSHWQSPHSGSLTHGVRVILVEKAKCKPLGLTLFVKTVNQKQYCIAGGLQSLVPTYHISL